MYKVNVGIKGTVGLLQNKFSNAELEGLTRGSKKVTGSTDYSMEWAEKAYINNDGYLFQPASHIEGSLVRSAATFKIKGRGSKTWKDPIRAYVYCQPEEILHIRDGEPIKIAEYSEEDNALTILTKSHCGFEIDIRRVKVQRAAVARSRLMLNPGWELSFGLEVHDEQVRPEVLEEILHESGRAIGIGDFRPRYGRFDVTRFEVVNGK